MYLYNFVLKANNEYLICITLNCSAYAKENNSKQVYKKFAYTFSFTNKNKEIFLL